MSSLAITRLTSSFYQESGTTSRLQARAGELCPVKKLPGTTISGVPDILSAPIHTSVHGLQSSFDPPISRLWSPTSAKSAPLQIWEGTVLSVEHAADVMHVQLNAKMGNVPRHTAEIDLQWVSDQDEDLVRPGAVFYLTLFKETDRGSIKNSQELRFRRRPSWSSTQLRCIDEDASRLLAKMRHLPTAE